MRWWIVGLALVPVALILELLHAPPLAVLLAAAAALVPLAALLGRATEEVAARTGPLVGGLLNSTLGNAAELIIALAALRAGLHELVKASISGSILGNLLLILGASLLVGGLRHGMQQFDAQLAGVSATMMTLAVVLLLVPGLFTLGPTPVHGDAVEWMSIGLAIVLAVIYGLYVLYIVRRGGPVLEHAHASWSLRRGIVVLALATIGVVVMSEVLVGAVEPVVAATGISEFFLGVVLVPLVGNVAEHFVAVQVAGRNQMDLSLNIAYGSSLQVALLVTPVLIGASLLTSQPMSLVFNVYELVALLGAALVSTLIALDGRSHWLEGAMLLAVYAGLGVGFFFLP
ncbi:calcium/proton exchanger [Thermomicrobium sp. 4228-Ro]|uniref:calcium/proton exchanger n=1 Tax=Thermomicrobium sp. 4228-Ro TaxID=2993937 RepID=UPI002248CDD8|nr:calcium/proton exchanger [Thermomicrobium sp. 4228-Ro]MCX2727320.1 calcium/proton exchanger [Thermomicrobium sp. 4228-Ro]